MELTDREVKKIASLYNKLVRIGKYSKLSGEELRSKVGEKVVARENDYGEDEFYARNFDEPFADETYVRYKPKTLEKIDKEYKPKKQAKKAQKQEQAKQVVKGVAVKEKKLKKKELKPSIFDIPPVIEESSFQVKKLKVPSQLNVEAYSPELDEDLKIRYPYLSDYVIEKIKEFDMRDDNLTKNLLKNHEGYLNRYLDSAKQRLTELEQKLSKKKKLSKEDEKRLKLAKEDIKSIIDKSNRELTTTLMEIDSADDEPFLDTNEMEDMVQKSKKVLEKIEKLVETAPEEVDDSQKIIDEYEIARKAYEDYKRSIPRKSKDKKKFARLKELEMELEKAKKAYEPIEKQIYDVRDLFNEIENKGFDVKRRIEKINDNELYHKCVKEYVDKNFMDLIKEDYNTITQFELITKALENMGVKYIANSDNNKIITDPYEADKLIKNESFTEEDILEKLPKEILKIKDSEKPKIIDKFLNGTFDYRMASKVVRDSSCAYPAAPFTNTYRYQISIARKYINKYLETNEKSIKSELNKLRIDMSFDKLVKWKKTASLKKTLNKLSNKELQDIIKKAAQNLEREGKEPSYKYYLGKQIADYATNGIRSKVSRDIAIDAIISNHYIRDVLPEFIKGGGFWGDFAKGFKQGFMGTLGVAKDILPFVI